MIHDLVRGRAEHLPPNARSAAVSNHEKVAMLLLRVLWQRLTGMTDANVAVRHKTGGRDLLRRLLLYLSKESLRGMLLVLDFIDGARIVGKLHDRNQEELGLHGTG